MKKYLLMAGNNYYPCSGTNDWIACFSTWEEANAAVTPTENHIDKKRSIEYYIINDNKYDWFEIVDLSDWIYG